MIKFALWPILIVVTVATFTDLRSRRIPNWLVLPFLLAGVVVSPIRHDWQGSVRGFGWHGLGQSLAGLSLSLLINGIPFFMGWTGGGDVKLFAAIGAWVGPVQFLWAFFFTAFAGGVLVLGWVVYGFLLKGLIRRAGDLFFGWKQREICGDQERAPANLLKRKIPYAPAIAIGTLLSFFAG